MRNIVILIGLLVFFASCQSPEARRPVTHSSGSFINKSAERNKEIYKQEEALIKQLMQEDTSQTYFASQKGFWYYYNKKDSVKTRTPVLGDTIIFKYTIKHLNGTVILSEEETGEQHYIVDKTNQDLISGIRDGLKLMKEGEIVTFLLPSYKAYGYYGIENKLGTNIPIQSTVILKSISQKQENKQL